MIRIDLEKAYDRLSWSFIRDTLESIGLSSSWTRNIMKCVESSRMSITWNGDKLEWFRPASGIRQGDSISPYLFVLCMERLGHVINQAVSEGKWKPIKLSRRGPPLSHLFCADDLILFVEASESQIVAVMACLDLLCNSSGQKISLNKSNIFFSPGVEKTLVTKIIAAAKIQSSSMLDKYLGTPSITGCAHTRIFSSILDRLGGRLEGWKAKYLSIAGRTVLA